MITMLLILISPVNFFTLIELLGGCAGKFFVMPKQMIRPLKVFAKAWAEPTRWPMRYLVGLPGTDYLKLCFE